VLATLEPEPPNTSDVSTADPGGTPILRKLPLPIGSIGIVVGCLLPWREAMRTGQFDDSFWHHAAGTWMLDHHEVMTKDVFSYTVTGHSWMTPEWGYDVLLAETARLVGPLGFWMLSAGVATLTVVAVALLCKLVGAGWLWTGVLSIEVGAAVTLFLDDRPQVVSYFLVALLLVLLAVGRQNRAFLVAIPLLFVLWANLHGSFLLGLAVLALEAIVTNMPRRVGRLSVDHPLARRDALLLLVTSGVATLINPFGLGVYRSALGVSSNAVVRQLIGEWQSPDFHDPATMAIVVVPLVLTLAYLVFSREPVPAVELVLAVFLLAATLDAARFLPYLAIAWCALAARCSPLPKETLRPSLVVWPVLALLGVAFLAGPTVPAGQAAASVPVGAVDYLVTHPGRVFSTYLWNDYLVYRGVPDFIDGRTELFTGTPVFDQYLAVNGLTRDPDGILRRYRVEYVLWPTGSPLSVFLEHDPAWTIARRTDQAIVFRSVSASASDGNTSPTSTAVGNG
jgi:hypothetical protein